MYFAQVVQRCKERGNPIYNHTALKVVGDFNVGYARIDEQAITNRQASYRSETGSVIANYACGKSRAKYAVVEGVAVLTSACRTLKNPYTICSILKEAIID